MVNASRLNRTGYGALPSFPRILLDGAGLDKVSNASTGVIIVADSY